MERRKSRHAPAGEENESPKLLSEHSFSVEGQNFCILTETA